MEKMAGSAESYVRVVSCNAVIGSCERSYKELCIQKVFPAKVSGISGDLVCLHMWPDQDDLGQFLCAGWVVCLAACQYASAWLHAHAGKARRMVCAL